MEREPPTVMPYGEWTVSIPPIEPLHADRIRGALVLFDKQRRPEWVDIQWESAGDKVCHQLQMDFQNALFLLSVLKAIQLDTGTPFPDDPRVKRRG